MNTTITNTSEKEVNAAKIAFSVPTKTLINCRAKMSDVLSDVVTAMNQTFGEY